MRNFLLFVCLFLSSHNLFCSESVSQVWKEIIDIMNGVPGQIANNNNLEKTLQEKNDTLKAEQAALDSLKKQISDLKKQQDEIKVKKAIADQESNVILRGKINNIINSTKVAFSILWPDKTRTVVAANSTVLLNQPFNAYKDGNSVGGIISIIPQINGADISVNNAEKASVGLSYSLLFNVQGLNQLEFPYGALNYLSITRSATPGATRAHSIYLGNSAIKNDTGLLKKNEIWAVDITINYVSGLAYPRFSTLYSNEFDDSNTSTIPDVKSQKTWAKQVVLNQSNAATNLCVPKFDETEMWTDIPN